VGVGNAVELELRSPALEPELAPVAGAALTLMGYCECKILEAEAEADSYVYS
jgi:hypothetical protein